MNKLELITAFKNQTQLNKDETDKIVNLFFDKMADALADNDRVEIRGLCSFYVKHYKSYTGRNPKTGENVEVSPKRLPFFKCGKDLKDRVNS